MNVFPSTLAFLNLSAPEGFFLFLVILLFFGPKRLPDLARSVGQAMREFKKAANDVDDNFRSAMAEEDRKKEEERKRAAASITPAAPAPARPVETHAPEQKV